MNKEKSLLVVPKFSRTREWPGRADFWFRHPGIASCARTLGHTTSLLDLERLIHLFRKRSLLTWLKAKRARENVPGSLFYKKSYILMRSKWDVQEIDSVFKATKLGFPIKRPMNGFHRNVNTSSDQLFCVQRKAELFPRALPSLCSKETPTLSI